jgi:hypothetical protein
LCSFVSPQPMPLPTMEIDCYSRMSINHVVAFTAAGLLPCLTIHFFLDYAQHIVIEGFPLHTSFPIILGATGEVHCPLARHTNIVYLHLDDNALSYSSTHYQYIHERSRPWGNRLPLACKQCKAVRPWSKVIKVKSTLLFTCRACTHYTIRFPKPEGWKLLSKDRAGGHWMTKDETL